jgi:hypothetical protein
MGERVTGIGENAQAVWKMGGRRTATEAGLIAAGLETRIGEVASAIEEKNLVDIVYMEYNQELLNLTEPMKFRILGRRGAEFRTIEKSGILHKGAFDVKPVGSKFFANRAMATNQYLQGIQTIANVPPFQPLTDMREVLKQMWIMLGQKNPERLMLDDAATDYRVPPEMENLLLNAGHPLEIGNQDNDQEHIQVHTMQMDGGDYPPENRPAYEEHIAKHDQRIQAMQQSGSMTQFSLPQTEANVMGAPFQTFGGARMPAGPGMEGAEPGPQAPPQTF